MTTFNSHNTNLHAFSIDCGPFPYEIRSKSILIGKDLTVTIGGGTFYHIGAVAVAWPEIHQQRNDEMIKCNISIISVPGHKEDKIVRKAAEILSISLNGIVTVISGLHIDQASAQDIEKLVDNYFYLIDKIVVYCSKFSCNHN